MNNPEEKPAEKKPRKRQALKAPKTEQGTQVPDLDRLVMGLVKWHLSKVNGDPQEEYFEILLHENGTNGGCMAKFVMGDFEESKKRLRQQLEERVNGIDMYAYSYSGYWTAPTGERHDGAIVTLETRTLLPTILGFVIKPNEQGTQALTGQPHPLGTGDWSLFHRAKA